MKSVYNWLSKILKKRFTRVQIDSDLLQKSCRIYVLNVVW